MYKAQRNPLVTVNSICNPVIDCNLLCNFEVYLRYPTVFSSK